MNKTAYKLKHCGWIPHRPSEIQKQTRVTPSKRFLDLLRSIQHQVWKYLVKLNEAWFYFSNHRKQIWLPDDEDFPTIDQQTISSPKTMLTMVWNLHRFHFVNVLPRGQKWTSQCYVDHILPEIGTLRDARDRRKLLLHADNSKPLIVKRVK
jgi:hypothetical protein